MSINKEVFTNHVISLLVENVPDFAKRYNLISHIPLGTQKNTVVFDFSSPNIAKPFHFGHLRSTILGNSLANLHSYFGNNVIRINYLGDWGTQFGILSLGYDLFGNEEELIRSPLKHLLEVYVKANEENEKNEAFKTKAKERVILMQNQKGDNPTSKEDYQQTLLQWQRFREYSIKEYKSIYDRLRVRFDTFQSESMFDRASLEIVEKLEALGLVQLQSDGSKIVSDDSISTTTSEGKIPVVLIKKDGSTLYLTRYLMILNLS